MSKEFINSIQLYASFSDDEIGQVVSHIEEVHLKKGEILLGKGEICKALWFLETGSLRQYYTDENLDEVITNLFVPHMWILDHASFTGQKAAETSIEAFEESTLLKLGINQLHHLIEQSPRFFALGKILESGIHPFTNPKDTPEKKYTNLITNQPAIIQTFPLKYIASYLCMTPETLSRVRKKIS